MRARRREINIFNMSLLDILCGALGAFCFMMLVALPYYIPPGSGLELRKAQSETDRLLKELGELKERMPDQKSVAEMEELMRQLEAQVKALQGRVNILTAEKQEFEARLAQVKAEKEELLQRAQALQAQNENLALENQNLEARLLAKKPFSIILRAEDPSQRLDVIVFKPSQMEKSPNPLFQEWLAGRFENMHTVRNALLYGRGVGLTVQTDAPPGGEGLLFVRVINDPESRRATQVVGVIADDESLVNAMQIPKATLSPERFWTLLGRVLIDQNSNVSFKAASEEERAAAWKTLVGNESPVLSTPTPPPAIDRAAVEAERKKRFELHKKFTRLNQLNPAKPEEQAEMINLSDELLKELPANDGTRRVVQSLRQHALDEKARGANSSATPAPATSP